MYGFYPMKILFISPHSSEISIGGIERHVKNLIDYCCQNSKEAVFLLPAFNDKESTQKINNVTVIKTKLLNLHHKKVFDKIELSKEETRVKSKALFDFLRDLVKKENIGIISAENFHLSLPPAYSLMLSMVSMLEHIPMVLEVHSFATNELQKSLIQDLDWEKVLCVSKSVTGDCFNKGISIQKLKTQYLGVNTREFKPNLDQNWLKKTLRLPKDSRVVLHASRIIKKKDILKEKGIIDLLEAFSPIYAKDPSNRLVIAIASAIKDFKSEFALALDKLKGYIQLHNLEGGVVLKQFKMEDMPLVYNGADVFVMASENETFGQVYIEAMACGAPVIGTNVGGIPEVITDNFDGFLVEPDNPSMLTQRLEELLYDESRRKEFILNGLKTVRKKFSADRQFSLLFNYLTKLASLKKAAKAEG